ncbi:MEI2 protein [Trifolium repens]|nr:MEI2 protein [Trifolium repens]
MSMDYKTTSVSKKNENEKQPSLRSSGGMNEKDQPPRSSVVNENKENPRPRSSSSCVRHPIQLGQLQWKGLPNTYTGLHHSPFLVIRPVGLGNLNHRSGGIYIPPTSLNNIASSFNESLNLHYQIDIDKIVCGEDARTTLMIQNIPYK